MSSKYPFCYLHVVWQNSSHILSLHIRLFKSYFHFEPCWEWFWNKIFSSWLFSVGLVTFESNWIICSRLLSLGQISNTLGFLLRRGLNAKCIAQFLSRRTFPSRIPNIGFCEIVKCTEGHVHSESVNHRWQLWFDAAALMVCALMFNFWNQINWFQCNLASLFCNVCINCQFS